MRVAPRGQRALNAARAGVKNVAEDHERFCGGIGNQPREAREDRGVGTVWKREAVYSTGLGFGFAIPHCKTDGMASSSIGVLKLKQPIEWGSLDGQPVQVVILLAMRESGASGIHGSASGLRPHARSSTERTGPSDASVVA